MKNVPYLAAIAFALSTGLTAAAEPWGVRELKVAQDSALALFREQKGDALYNAIAGFSIEKNAQGTSGRAAVKYVEGGIKKTVSYFCHHHEGDEIDCH